MKLPARRVLPHADAHVIFAGVGHVRRERDEVARRVRLKLPRRARAQRRARHGRAAVARRSRHDRERLGLIRQHIAQRPPRRFAIEIFIHRQRRAEARSESRNPRVAIREAPRLHDARARIRERRADDREVSVRLRCERGGSGRAVRIHGHAHVQFGDVQVHAEIVESLKIRAHRTEARRAAEMKLKTDPVERHAARFEILRHRVDRVGLRVVGLGAVVVVDEFAVRIRRPRADESLLDILRPQPRVADARRVVPDRAAQRAVVVERLIHHIPAKQPVAITARHRVDVIERDGLQLRRRPRSTREPRGHAAMPEQSVAARELPVRRGVIENRVGARKRIRVQRGVQRRELQRVLRAREVIVRADHAPKRHIRIDRRTAHSAEQHAALRRRETKARERHHRRIVHAQIHTRRRAFHVNDDALQRTRHVQRKRAGEKRPRIARDRRVCHAEIARARSIALLESQPQHLRCRAFRPRPNRARITPARPHPPEHRLRGTLPGRRAIRHQNRTRAGVRRRRDRETLRPARHPRRHAGFKAGIDEKIRRCIHGQARWGEEENADNESQCLFERGEHGRL